MTTVMFILALLSPVWLVLALVLAFMIYIDYDHVGVNHVAFHWQ
jgi:hypothetical protein